MESITHDSSNEDLKRKRQKYTVQSTDSSDNAKKAKGIFAVLPIEISENYSDENEKSREEKIKQQNRERSKRYRERKKMENGNKVSLSITDSSDDGRKSLEETRQKNREKSRRCRDKKRTLNLQAQNISIRQNVPYIIHTSQIPGPSKRDVAFIPPIDPNNSVFLEERIVQSQPASNLSQYVIHRSPISAGISSLKLRVQTYTAFQQNSSAHREFQKDFVENEFGHACDICDRLWFKNDLKYIPNNDTGPNIEFIRTMLLNVATLEIKICSTCFTVIKKQRIPPLSVYNGFKYPPVPENLKEFPLDLVTERLVSPRIPFMQIRRLRQVHGQLGIYGQVINIPIEVNTMANVLPRHVDDDHSVTVDIKKKKILKSSYVYSTVNKRNLKVWLQYLKDTPLYTSYGVTVDDRFLDDQNYEIDNESVFNEDGDNGILEQIPIEESLMALQQTLIWKDDMYLRMAPGEGNIFIFFITEKFKNVCYFISQLVVGNATNSLLFDQHAEELSFPQIYFGQFRHFRDGVTVTPFMMATSELRRSDRRGVTPQHLLYMAMNIMRIRIKESLPIASKDVGKGIEMQSDDYIQGCIESNLAFLRSIPNSDYYWAEVKRDLFAMIRQYGKPTVNFTVSANETGWPKLLQLLYNLKNNAEISADEAADLHFIEKSTLVNEDAVTCVLYFNKLVNVLLKILQSKRYSPFRKYRILNYFKRIEFQHEGSPRAHILAWLANAPEDAIGRDYKKAIDLIDFLISVSATEASGNILLQTHKHNFTCYKGIASKSPPECKFEAPFFPVKTTMILTPMEETDDRFNVYKAKYDAIRKSLEQNEYDDFESFYNENNIASDEDYVQIIRAGIKKPRVFPKREPHEKWHNPFNPFILNVAESNTDFQFITDDYSFAVYVVEYVNKTNRGVSNLQRKIIEIMDEHTEFNIFDITKNISINIFNQTEMTSQEAVWYLLREPVSKSSTIIEFIPTVWPVERQRIKKTVKELSELEDDSTDIWKENWFDKYEKRPEDIEHITLAQFVSKYYKNNKGHYVIRDEPRVIRYRNYDMATEYDEYKREMVILHLPFRDEQTEVLAEMRYLELYEENEALILERRKEFESNVDIKKILEICRDLCHENVTDGGEEIRDVGRIPDENPFDELYDNSRDEIMK